MFADYISNVLPELGEETIKECGMEELLSELLDGKVKFQTFFEQVNDLLENKNAATIERTKFKATQFSGTTPQDEATGTLLLPTTLYLNHHAKSQRR